MNKIDIKTRRTLLWAIFLSVGFPLGIAMTVIGFTKGQSFRAMGIVGIILIVMGFYGAPMVWIHFGQLKYFSRLKAQIVGDGIKSVKNACGSSQQESRSRGKRRQNDGAKRLS
ncbi:MAG: hypothetical protein L6V85_10765 [Clostridiales bacterium]|nr:MAG: hypothetical protein L6V85_10765 [Clostridiales bacterium]